MSSIIFLGTYKPMVCGIGDYTSFITPQLTDIDWGVISFDTSGYIGSLSGDTSVPDDRVWYGIPSQCEYSTGIIRSGVRGLGTCCAGDAILWFQHEHGIWHDDQRFINTLRGLSRPKVVTLHTVHFQSADTASGLRQNQYEFLAELLPNVDAVTVFSLGVYKAVTTAFPEYRSKVFSLRHGVHSYPDVARMTRREAREKLSDFLLYESDLSAGAKKDIYRQRLLMDPEKIIIGQAGFLDPSKQSEMLFQVGDELKRMMPGAKITSVRIGGVRESSQERYAAQLRSRHDGENRFLLEVLLPRDMLPVAQKAFDMNYYWPKDCTQSGALAHALGAGGVIAGRDLEGVGETLGDAGQMVEKDFNRLLLKMRDALVDHDLAEQMRESALRYAAEYSWKKQAAIHCEIADSLVNRKTFSSVKNGGWPGYSAFTKSSRSFEAVGVSY
ncbi:MAG: hypothetical protein R6U89_09850 [Dehalococcoidia bacterium]